MLYFAYGSNMATSRLTARIAEARRLGPALLPGYELKFNVRSTKDGSGKCNLCRATTPDRSARGVLYDIPDSTKEVLDWYEGTGVEYQDLWLPVITENGKRVEALLYLGLSIDECALPYPWYLEHVIRGAQESGHPDTFIDQLRSMATIADPDPERTLRELRIYQCA